MTKIALIEDDLELSSLLSEYLEQQGFEVSCFANGKDALSVIADKNFDLVVLDIMLPELNGFEVCKELKKRTDIPVIISSARDKTIDKVLGLELGADDYIAKPYEPIELIARINAVLRRYAPSSPPKSVFEIDEPAMIIRHQGVPLELTNSEYELLKIFLHNSGKVLNRDDIANRMPSIGWDSSSRGVDVLVSKLRGKLSDDSKHPKYIKSIWGVGYKFIGV